MYHMGYDRRKEEATFAAESTTGKAAKDEFTPPATAKDVSAETL